MKTISIPTNDRLELLTRCLDSIRQADGHEGWTLVFSCEPNQAVRDYIAKINWTPFFFSRNPCQMGCWVNTFLAANFAMQLGSEFNLYLEDDIIISRDTLTLADQFRLSRYPVLALRRPEATLTKEHDIARGLMGGLLGDGFAWRSGLWPQLRSLWFQPAGASRNFSMWDWSVEEGFKRERISQVRPCVNRSQNIGLNGTHQHGYDPNRHSPRWEGEPVKRFLFI